jgi:flagellin
MVINTNLAAMSSSSNLNTSQSRLAKSLARISSGSRLIQPGDDAGGQAVASKMDAQIHRLQAAKTNVANASSFVQTQDGYLKKIGKALDRMSELAILAQDVTKTNPDRDLYNMEFTELKDYIQAASTKEFNGVTLFSNTPLKVTIDSETGTLTMLGIDIRATGTAYGNATLDATGISTADLAATALGFVKSALTKLGSDRAQIGAYQAHLNYSAEQLTISKENLSAASSRIQDVDIADESTEYAKANIMVQSGTAMLAQANQLPQQVLRLLQ